MKKFSIILCAVSAMCVLLAIASAAATETLKTIKVSENINVIINGETFIPKDSYGNVIKPFVYNGIAYVPMGVFANALGYDATYDSKTQSTTITKKQETSALTEGFIYQAGETWTVKNQWELTINSVKTHYMCNEFADEENDLAQCVTITYSYKNLGYTDGLYMSSVYFNVYDTDGEAAEIYPCTHSKNPKELDIGTKCTGAQEVYALYNRSDYITIIVSLYASNGTGEQTAKFKINII